MYIYICIHVYIYIHICTLSAMLTVIEAIYVDEVAQREYSTRKERNPLRDSWHLVSG